MYKKIPTEQLQLGMYIHAMCGSWMSHPFWRKSFLLDKPKDLDKLQQSAVTHVWIDTSRGADLPSAAPRTAEHAPSPDLIITPDGPPEHANPTALGQELRHAVAVCEQAREDVIEMFNEARMGQALSTEKAERLVEEITRSVARNPSAMISVARLKTSDNYTYMHSVAVSALMVALAKKLGLSEAEVQQAGVAGLLHDMGKANTRPEVLNKPGALTDEEFAHMKQHPEEGYKILKGQVSDEVVLDACLHHHERMDGKGYPHQLAGEQISLMARMAAVCDVYDAITSNRPYKAGWAPPVALQRMAEWCKTHLDRSIFEAFVKTIGIYPVGSLVRLESGLLALVFAPSAQSMSAPMVVAFFDANTGKHLDVPKIFDLSKQRDQAIMGHEDTEKWSFENLDAIWQKAAQTLTEAA